MDKRRISLPGAATLAMVTALQCLVETGDNVVIVSPVWPSIFQAAQVVGGECRFVRLEEDWNRAPAGWRLDMDKLLAACDGRTKAIFMASPGNPTGWVATRAEQQAVLDFARARGIAIISDEVYGTLVYGERQHAPSFLEIAEPDDNVFVVNGFSKAWAMTGWRIGWLVHPLKLEKQMEVICVGNNTGPAAFAQFGALAALTPEGDAFRKQMLDYCRAGRKVVEEFLASQNRIRWIEPEGAFYGFLQIEGPDQQPRIREQSREDGAGRRLARLGLRPAGGHGERFLRAHLLRPEPGAPARRAGAVGQSGGFTLNSTSPCGEVERATRSPPPPRPVAI